MSTTYAGDPNNYPEEITIPSDGDAPDAASVNVALEGLADRTAAIQSLRVDEFTSSGTWTCPLGVTKILLQIIGGGGAGGAGGDGAAGGAGGGGAGGGGAEVRTISVTVVPTTVYTVTRGAGGVGTNGAGGNGGDSTFGALATARGGGGGMAGADWSAPQRVCFGGRSTRTSPTPVQVEWPTTADNPLYELWSAFSVPLAGQGGVGHHVSVDAGDMGTVRQGGDSIVADGGAKGADNSGRGGGGGGASQWPGNVPGVGGAGGAASGAGSEGTAGTLGAGGGGGGGGGGGAVTAGADGADGGNGVVRVIYIGPQAVVA